MIQTVVRTGKARTVGWSTEMDIAIRWEQKQQLNPFPRRSDDSLPNQDYEP